EGGSLEDVVDRLLDRHYPNADALNSEGATESGSPAEDDGGPSWRREQILDLIARHPAPLDTVATARLIGRITADRILDLKPIGWWDLPGQCGRLVRRRRRGRFRRRVERWPPQLRPGYLSQRRGNDDGTRGDPSERAVRSLWEKVPSPTAADLDRARRRLRTTANPLGLLVADALLSADVAPHEHRRRRHLREIKAAIVAAGKGEPTA
ncbi:MAG: hypothetical protein ACYTG0_15240, partial [Planctomycetota bacterium]